MTTIDLSEARDRDLVVRVRARDEEAFRGLFDRYAPSARALARRIVRQPHLADEIVQEAFMAVWRNPDNYDEHRGTVRSWLMTTVHHRAVDLVRREESHRRRTEAAIPDALATDPDPADEVAEQVDLPAERLAVRSALDEIPTEQRRVIELMYFDGMSQTQIATALDLPLGTVKSRTLLGMRRLRAALGGVTR